ncbi:hypothetical protein GOBAR_AA15675 [Gossypium barbadense]|uniref:Piwi domain-containing protein n=1 Tax=Gossypium barbadense TaxID=3634 RepID=A0A2P5XNS7_GOSBA|nr:hypothetical protein GOBAR_AA15675 [Gossypium barbadense]
MTETGKNWHKKLLPTLYAYAGANTFNSSCFKVSDKVDDGIMKEALLDFYTSSGKRKPDQIIIFRDGVSEPQFNQVLIKLLRLASSLTRSGTLKIVVIVLHSWGQFMKIRDASEISSSHGGMYAPRLIFVLQLSRLKDKGLTNNSQDCCWGNPFLMGL